MKLMNILIVKLFHFGLSQQKGKCLQIMFKANFSKEFYILEHLTQTQVEYRMLGILALWTLPGMVVYTEVMN